MTSIPPPAHYKQEFSASEEIKEQIRASRSSIRDILSGKDERLLVLVGPCSIHDPGGSGLEYAKRLAEVLPHLSDRLFVVMRTFLEKPRTTVGWEGLIVDPRLTGEFDIALGLAEARKFLLSVLELGLPTATEFTSPLTPFYLADLVCWTSIGARSSEAAALRNAASGLDMPVGFKNGTGGSVQLAVDGIISAASPHAFIGVSEEGMACQVRTNGNPLCHLVLRGSLTHGPNHEKEAVAGALKLLKGAGLSPRLMIDCSHGNSGKDPEKQKDVCFDVLAQRLGGNKDIVGLMIESHLIQGSQKLGDDPRLLQYGLSITDPCMGWEETESLLEEIHKRA
jgi:3-deoxy-7-phosphoheptulonate synthase